MNYIHVVQSGEHVATFFRGEEQAARAFAFSLQYQGRGIPALYHSRNRSSW